MSMTSREKANQGSLDKMSELEITGTSYQGTQYNQNYVDAVFMLWYGAGKPTNSRLRAMCPNPADFGLAITVPSEQTISKWVREQFVERAGPLDEAVSLQMANGLIAEKVQMLNKHAELGTRMQEMALDYLENNAEKINSMAAVRLLVEGVRIERESRGIPRTLEKMVDRSDDELLHQIEDMLRRTPTSFEALGDGDSAL